MKKTFRALPILLALCFALCMSSGASRFTDITEHPQKTAILRAVDEGIVSGYENGTFRPNEGVTRAEFCAMLNRTLGITGYSVLDFTDVSTSDWFFGDVRNAVTAGYIVGLPDHRFDPNGPITRYQCAVMLARVTKFSGSSVSLTYTDAAGVPEWARDGVAFVQESGVFSSFAGKRFDGGKTMTRAETAAALVALLDSLERLPVFYSLVTADGDNRPLNTTTLYKNEYAVVSFTVSGRGLTSGYEPSGDAGADRDRLAADLAFSITGAIGIRTMTADGAPAESPAYTFYTCPDENTFLFTIVMDRADYLPAWLTATVKLPHDGALAERYVLQHTSVFVKYSAIGEYFLAADNPRIVHRAVPIGSSYPVHRYLSWTAHPEAESYTVTFYVCRSDGTVIDSSRSSYTGGYERYGDRVEIDITSHILADPAAHYGEGAYQVVSVTAETSSKTVSFYPTSLPLSAASYVRLSLGGHDASTAVVLEDGSGVSLRLDGIHFDELTGVPSSSLSCSLRIAVLDAEYRDVTASFALDGAVPMGKTVDITAGIRSGALSLGTLTASAADAGCCTLLLQFDIQDNAGNLRTLVLSGALVVS
ncbi:MAG: S-layer homology domain-containing protein [Eubacteriales bacterium]|nr:S-layer homology domain-containing protein [Eubacteriales bacterium]